MEIEAAKLKEAIAIMLQRLKELDLELTAHRIVLESIKVSNAVPAMPWDHALDAARKHPAVLAKMEERYKALSDQILGGIDYADLQARVLELLSKWKPSGPPN